MTVALHSCSINQDFFLQTIQTRITIVGRQVVGRLVSIMCTWAPRQPTNPILCLNLVAYHPSYTKYKERTARRILISVFNSYLYRSYSPYVCNSCMLIYNFNFQTRRNSVFYYITSQILSLSWNGFPEAVRHLNALDCYLSYEFFELLGVGNKVENIMSEVFGSEHVYFHA